MKYRLSEQSIADIKGIYRYAQSQFGSDQAVAYHSSLEALFIRLGDNPEIGRARTKIDAGTRSFGHQSHVVYYEIQPAFIFILRVLHSRQDPMRHLS